MQFRCPAASKGVGVHSLNRVCSGGVKAVSLEQCSIIMEWSRQARSPARQPTRIKSNEHDIMAFHAPGHPLERTPVQALAAGGTERALREAGRGPTPRFTANQTGFRPRTRLTRLRGPFEEESVLRGPLKEDSVLQGPVQEESRAFRRGICATRANLRYEGLSKKILCYESL